MNHFTLGDWADFVRRLKEPNATTEMQRHLDANCKRCLKVVRIWRDLFTFGSRERLYSPPGRVLRSVEECYGLLKPERSSRVAVLARLIFDSSLQPAPAGIRSSQALPRQLIYSGGNLLIDIQLEHKMGRVYVTGQAQRRAVRAAEQAGTEVLALKGTRKVARTACNQFGEFQLEFDSGKHEGFSIVLKGGASIVMRLRGAP